MKHTAWIPPKVWQMDQPATGKFANINRPESGALFEQTLPVGNHPLQLYSLGTPNGIKISILLEELLEMGIEQARYDAHLIDIMHGDQFGSGFVAVNPNSKIPALVDRSEDPPLHLFESGAILLYLAEKFSAFIPTGRQRAVCLSWLFWQVGSAPYVGGGFGHFFAYAPEKMAYPINRFTMETKRQLDLLNKHLSQNAFICGEDYTIADMAICPWYGALVQGELYQAAEFLDARSYPHVLRWADEIGARNAVRRGKTVLRR
ncbi:glutathione-dependent disulfide-bond oxidoreductase [Affinibrenneria salicis]|uniref:Glutathione-dependent disulfide-bond oxidoreductase n=1 Tax=Affinibrenneria salicis TaxID=2590031 RepID=A0A5J5G329_9GAMM|nr:glutathione-dependent disulfide-bond oxidoreductase [Affinibrenneria salicis]KAA9001268.1 glutathione-dependent disulfide-bond oxidoreductase [Affinibrenneria salicis]